MIKHLRTLALTASLLATLSLAAAPAQAGTGHPPQPTKHDQATIGYHAPKGFPDRLRRTPTNLAKSLLTCSPACYFYNVGSQSFSAGSQPTGAYASFTIPNPAVTAGDYHSLAEISIEEFIGGQRQIVEIGWRKAAGGAGPELFVFHWVNGVPQCYNGCGFVDYAPNTVDAGDALTVGATRRFGIARTTTAWWFWEGTTAGVGDWVGHIPDTKWTGAVPSVVGFQESAKTQYFGEVAASNATTTTDMGDGNPGSLGPPVVGALIGSATNVGGPAANISPVFETPTCAGYNPVLLSGSVRSFAYGGTGC